MTTHDPVRSSEHATGLVHDLAEHLECLDDGLILKRHGTLDPLVVHLGSVLAEDDVLDPVGSDPTGRGEALHR